MTPKSGQDVSSALQQRLLAFDPDTCTAAVVGQMIEISGNDDAPMHRHLRGQLLITLRGAVTCETADGLWPIPLDTGLWIPGGQSHRSTVSSGATIGIVYLANNSVRLPGAACFIALTPLMREMVLHLARLGSDYTSGGRHAGIAKLLLSELGETAVDRFFIASPKDARLRRIADLMLKVPGDRRTLAEWADFAAMSERTLRRLIARETGVTFGAWRQQFQMAVAVQELRMGTPIKMIAQRLGYESVSAFATMFKSCMGRPPGEYAARAITPMSDRH